jgi:prepilin-type N-terminal cleavage/methylation domain-containing protein
MLTRRGATLFEVIVTVAILAVIAGAVYLNEAQASKLGGASANVDQAAQLLAEIADAAGRTTGTGGVTSFNQLIGQANANTSANAGKLSQLTTPLTSAHLNSCMYQFTNAEAGRWVTPFFFRILPTTGFQLAPGYFAQDSLIRYDQNGVATTIANRPAANDAASYGTLAIVMPSTQLSDALALLNRVEGNQTGLGAVRYYPTDGTSPVTLEYHFTIRGC